MYKTAQANRASVEPCGARKPTLLLNLVLVV